MAEKSSAVLGKHAGGVTRVMVVGDQVYSAGLDQCIRRFPASQSASELIRFANVRLYPKEPQAKPYAAWFDIADGMLACAMKHGIVELYDLKSGKHLRSLENPPVNSAYHRDFDSVAFVPGHSGQVVASNGRYAVAWDTKTGKMLWQDTMGSRINFVAFLRGGKYLLLQEWGPLLRIVQWPGGKSAKFQFEMVQGSWNLVTSRACPKKGKIDFAVSALDADGGYLLGMKLEEEEPVFQIQFGCRQHDQDFLPDGRHIIAGGDDGILRFIDTQNEKLKEIPLAHIKEVAALSDEAEANAAGILCTKEIDDGSYSPRAIHCVSISADGSWAAVGLVGGLVLKVELPG